MKLLFLSSLLSVALTVTYNFNSAIIDLNTLTSTASVNVFTAVDQCSKMVARNGGLYHLSKESVYQSWAKGILGTQRSQVTSALTAVDLSVNPE